MTGAGSWSLGEQDYHRITEHLNDLLRESNARCAMLVDRTGQLLASAGEQLQFDPTAFASLTAADFSANDQLAKMIGEPEFASLFHQGEKESMYLALMEQRGELVFADHARELVVGTEVGCRERGKGGVIEPELLAGVREQLPGAIDEQGAPCIGFPQQ